MAEGISLVLVTCGGGREARRIAHHLVERRLAACVNIVPFVSSIYRWRDKIERAREYLLIVKTRSAFFQRICRAIKAEHSYHCPEIVRVDIGHCFRPYRDWLLSSTRSV